MGGGLRGDARTKRTAREIARTRDAPIYTWENGKAVAKEPRDDGK